MVMSIVNTAVCVDIGLSPNSVEAAYVPIGGVETDASRLFKNSLVEALSAALISQRPISAQTDDNNNIVSLNFASAA